MRRLGAVFGVLIVGLAGCGSATDAKATAGSSGSAPVSKPPPPKVPGKLLVMAGNRLKLLTQEADGHLSNAPLDVPQFEEYEVMADHKTLVYRTGAVVTARNLADGSEKKLASDAKSNKLCLRTSPDSKRVSFRRADDLVVADLAGKVTVLDKVKRDKYGTGTITATTALGCGEWLDNTHVTFDRRKSLPETINVKALETDVVVEADTTTVAVLGGKNPKLLDSPSMWHPTAICGNWVVANNGTNKDVLHLRQRTGDGDVTKAGAFTGAELAITGTAGSTHGVLFVPGSCRPLLFSVDKRTFQTVDPATRAVGATPVATLPGGGIEVHLFDEPANWQPAQGAEVLAAVVDKQVVIVDMHAGTAVPVPADGLDAASRVIAWLP
ncbi:hypothetical protein AB0K00_06305 [Dactylosporangium sp. NPDC049525]|uniref:hypothetical protein n=1 Tax=Dactylosporangium sp. NPDC049525 TaxID=3154730 RepID=UPI00341EA1FF